MTAINSPFSPARSGFTNSQTMSLSLVTSKALPPVDSVIRVFPLGSLIAEPSTGEANPFSASPSYDHEISSVSGLNSITLEKPWCPLLSNSRRFPFSRTVGSC